MRLTDHSQLPYTAARRRAASESLGRVARVRPLNPSADPATEPAWAHDSGLALAGPDAVERHAAARADRARRLGDALAHAAGVIRAALRRARAGWDLAAQRRATVRALRDLDARTLRDLGLDRSELTSVAWELERDDPTTRLRSVRAAAFRHF